MVGLIPNMIAFDAMTSIEMPNACGMYESNGFHVEVYICCAGFEVWLFQAHGFLASLDQERMRSPKK